MESLNLQVVAVLMPLEIKRHTVPHLKVLNSGLDPWTRCGHGMTFTLHHTTLKSVHFHSLTLFYMGGGIKSIPPNWLLYTNPHWMPWMDWFFMTLFLSILERSWVGHFWDFFLKFPKNFTSTIFSIYNPKGGPFYASVRTPFARNFFVLFRVKNGNNSTSNALLMGNNNQFLPKHAFLPSLNHFSSF